MRYSSFLLALIILALVVSNYITKMKIDRGEPNKTPLTMKDGK